MENSWQGNLLRKCLKIDDKEKTAIECHFSDVNEDLIESVLTKKLAFGKTTANFKKVFTQQQLIISTCMENVVTTEFVEWFIKSRFSLTSEEYNTRLFHSLRIIWHHYCLIKVTLLDWIVSHRLCCLIKTCCVFHLNDSFFNLMRWIH